MDFTSTQHAEASSVKDYLASVPSHARTNVTLKVLQCMMLTNDGSFTARGLIWDVKSRRVCPGVYSVWVEERQYNES